MMNNNIVKDLESVIDWFTKHGSNTNTAVIDISRRAIDVIERQKAEIERLTALVEAPVADVVEVVRCKDCIHSKESPMRIICQRYRRDVNEGDFCSYGERKEE